MNESLINIVSVLIGIVVGALFSRNLEAKKHTENLKAEAYIDFIKAVASKNQKEITKVADAKARIAIYGSKNVINKLANFFRKHQDTMSREAAFAFSEIVQEMKKDFSHNISKGLAKDISVLVINMDDDGTYDYKKN